MELLTKHKLIKESEFMELLTNNIKCNDCIKQHYSIYPLLKIFLEKNASRSAVLNLSRDGELNIYLSGDSFINYKLECDVCEELSN